MYKVKMSLECGCFKRSAYEAQTSFDTKENALSSAKKMVDDMNNTFCQKHTFSINDKGDDILIDVVLS